RRAGRGRRASARWAWMGRDGTRGPRATATKMCALSFDIHRSVQDPPRIPGSPAPPGRGRQPRLWLSGPGAPVPYTPLMSEATASVGPYTWDDFVALEEDALRELIDGELVE